MGLINLGAGLAAAGGAVSKFAGDLALQQQKSNLESQKLELADQLERGRQWSAPGVAETVAAGKIGLQQKQSQYDAFHQLLNGSAASPTPATVETPPPDATGTAPPVDASSAPPDAAAAPSPTAGTHPLPQGFDAIPDAVKTQMKNAFALGGPEAGLKIYTEWATEQNKIFDQRQNNRLVKGSGEQIGAPNTASVAPFSSDDKKKWGLLDGDVGYIDNGKPVILRHADNPNQPFNPDGSPNTAFQDWELKKTKAGIDMRAAANAGAPSTPEEKTSIAAQAATGMPLNQIIPGYGGAASRARQEARQGAIDKIRADNPNMTAADAGIELANRTIEFQSGKKSSGQLTNMLGATKQAVGQLDFNIGKTKEEMKKLGSTDLSPILNAIARGEEKWTGDPAYSSLYFYMSATANESARLQSGGQASAAQLHQGAMDEAKKWANMNMTPASFDAVAQAMQEEGAYKLQTYGDALKSQRVGNAGTDAAPPPATKAPVQIHGDADYNSLPSGAEFIAPDGSHRRKP